jgi:group I intron endonuclease
MKSGIYKISCLANGRCYIGSAKNIVSRFIEHRKTLRAGNHSNRHLKFAWNKYGKDAFTFYVLEYCCIEDLLSREQFFIDEHTKEMGWDNLFNINPIAGSCLGCKRSDETRKKISLMNTGRKHTDELKQKLSQIHKGRKQTTEWIAKRMAAHVGSKRSDETKLKLSIARKKRVTTEETIKKKREAMKISPEHRVKINEALRLKAELRRQQNQIVYEYK